MVSAKVKKAPATTTAAAGGKSAKTTKVTKIRNPTLSDGVYRFSRGKTYHKKGNWKFVGKKTQKPVKPKKALTVQKTVGGEKNGGTRVVLVKKRLSYYPTHTMPLFTPRTNTKEQKVYTRPSLVPGTICIVLAGRYQGRRVVLVKVLPSGLALVTGPHKVNGCPLRRVHPNFLIATSTKIDMSSVKVPEKFNDEYFRRKHAKKAKKEDGEIFAKKAEVYAVSEERKSDQKALDKQIFAAIKKTPGGESKQLFGYLSKMFKLSNSQYPHRMNF